MFLNISLGLSLIFKDRKVNIETETNAQIDTTNTFFSLHSEFKGLELQKVLQNCNCKHTTFQNGRKRIRRLGRFMSPM